MSSGRGFRTYEGLEGQEERGQLGVHHFANQRVLDAIRDGRHALLEAAEAEPTALVLRQHVRVGVRGVHVLRIQTDEHRLDVPERHDHLLIILEDVDLVPGLNVGLHHAVEARSLVRRRAVHHDHVVRIQEQDSVARIRDRKRRAAFSHIVVTITVRIHIVTHVVRHGHHFAQARTPLVVLADLLARLARADILGCRQTAVAGLDGPIVAGGRTTSSAGTASAATRSARSSRPLTEAPRIEEAPGEVESQNTHDRVHTPALHKNSELSVLESSKNHRTT